jgi:hypothetical protein
MGTVFGLSQSFGSVLAYTALFDLFERALLKMAIARLKYLEAH